MTMIDGIGGAGRAAPLNRGGATRANSPGFALPETSAGASDATCVGAATPTALLGVMLALQEAEADRARNRAARRHGEAMLKELTELQLGLLGGGGGVAAMRHLAGLADTLPEAADPRLAALMQALAVRAQVELARRREGTE